MLNPELQAFIQQRQRFIAAWPWVAAAITLFLIALIGFIAWRAPYMINPFWTARALAENQIGPELLQIMAILLPIIMIWLFLVLFMLVLLGNRIIANEKQYIALYQALEQYYSNIKSPLTPE